MHTTPLPMESIKKTLDIIERFPSLIPNESCNLWKGIIHLNHEDVPVVMFTSEGGEFSLKCPLHMRNAVIEHFKSFKVTSSVPLSNSIGLAHLSSLNLNTSFLQKTLHELNDIGSQTIVACSGDLSEVTLRSVDSRRLEHRIVMKLPPNYPIQAPVIANIDLPEVALHELCQAETITEIYSTFQKLIDSFQHFWIMYEDLLAQSWVIDPEHRSYKDCHCRIVVGENVSMLLTFNPQEADNCPEIKFLGPHNATAPIIGLLEKNLKSRGWNEDLDIIENLLSLLNMSSFPCREIETECFMQQQECSICFMLKTDDNEHPTKVCNNAKCTSYFHITCLAQWFLAVPTNEANFNLISGDCPSCGERVLCSIKSN